MSYKIAVASTDGINVDQTFGETPGFDIYEVEGIHYHLIEKRNYTPAEATAPDCSTNKSCGTASGCGTKSGCDGAGGAHGKVQLINDCRCIVCKKIGFNIQKQLEKLAITSFDVECSIEEALTKITSYLNKIDGHQSLRGLAKER